MKKIICVMIVMILSTGAFAADTVSILNFNEFVSKDEAGMVWNLYGKPALSPEQSISGGKSLHLDGNSYLQARNTKAFDFPGQFTLEAWVYPQKFVSDSYGGENFSIFSRWNQGKRTLYLVDIARGKLSFYTDFMGMMSIESSSIIPLNEWTHIAVTRDAMNTVRLFVNGKLESQKVIQHKFTSNEYPMTIGASSNAMRRSIGFIDDVKVYRTCLYTDNFVPAGRIDAKAKCPCGCEFFSAADEIRKFKALLDEKIITPAEFEAAKKKLLGM